MAIDYETTDRIAYISYCRPEKHNAVRDEDMIDLAAALTRFDQDDDADVGILHGKGPSFSTGADVDDLQRTVEQKAMTHRISLSQQVTDAVLGCEHFKPLIAAVHGYCLGYGITTAFLCDLVVAERTARLQISETRYGVPGALFWAAMGGSAFGMEVTLTARFYTAEEAAGAGVIARLVDDGDHLRAAQALAREILVHPQRGVREDVRVRRAVLAEQLTHLRGIIGRGFGDWAATSDGHDRLGTKSGQQ